MESTNMFWMETTGNKKNRKTSKKFLIFYD